MLGLDQELLDRLFERAYKPFRSRNARTLYNIFIVEKEAEYLTTLDIQTHLDGRGIDLSKKEINAWLRSLQEAGLITKERERGKPTTLAYDDKYTFDKWSLTTSGLKVSEDLRDLISDSKNEGQYPKSHETDGHFVDNSATPSREDNSLKARYLQSMFLTELRRSSGRMEKRDLIKKMIPENLELDHALSALIGQGLVDIKQQEERGFLTRVLVNLGLKHEDIEIQLTDKGYQLRDQVYPLSN